MAELGEYKCPTFRFDDGSSDDMQDSTDKANEHDQALDNENHSSSEHEDEVNTRIGSTPAVASTLETSLILQELKNSIFCK